MVHRRVAELRLALRTADGALDKTCARFEEAEVARNEAESEAAALRARVWIEGAEALGTRLHDGSLDLLRGELLNEATAELEEAARATAEAEERARKRLLLFVRLKTRQLRLPPRQAERLEPFPWRQLGCAAS